jgi:hypothetical protein
LKTYTVTIATAGTGTGTLDQATQSVNYGSSLTVNATPAVSSDFAGWSGDATGTDSATLTNITANKSITATFTLKTYTVTIATAGTGTGTLDQATQSVNYGSSLTVNATPAVSSDFAGWSGDATGTGTATLTNITSSKTLTATFTLVTFTITSTNYALPGTISPVGEVVVSRGSSQVFSFSPVVGYYISNVEVDGSYLSGSLGSSYTFSNVTQNHTIIIYNRANNSVIWDGQAADNNWSSADNWTGNVVPTANDDVIFNSAMTRDSVIDTSFAGNVKSLTIAAGYTGIITSNKNLTVTGDFTLAQGSFDANDYNVTTTNFVSSGSIARSVLLGNGTWTISGNWDTSGTNQTIAPELSTVDMIGSGTLNSRGYASAPYDFYNLKLAHNGKTSNAISSVTTANILYTYAGGTLNGDARYAFRMFKSNGDPVVNTGANFTASTFLIYRPSVDITVTGQNFGLANVAYSGITNDVAITLSSDVITSGEIYVYSITSSKRATLNVLDNNLSARNLYLSYPVYGTGTVNLGSGEHEFTNGIFRYDNSTATTNVLNLESSSVSIGGNIDFTGMTVDSGTSTVRLNGAGNQSVSGSNIFNNLSATAASARTISFASGTTQTVNGTLSLSGSSAGNLTLNRLGNTGTDRWKIDPRGTRDVSFVDVTDSQNLFASMINPADSVDSGNNDNWFPPTGTISFATPVTNTEDITLTLTTNNATEMRLSNSSNFTGSNYETFAATKAWTLAAPTVDGTKTVYAIFKDVYGNESATISATVILDTTATSAPLELTATAGNTSVSLSWTNPTGSANSDFSNVAIYRSTKADFTPAIDNSLGHYDEILNNKIADTSLAETQTFVDNGVSNNVTYYYKAKAIDAADNYSVESNQASAKADSDLPTTPATLTLSDKTNIKEGIEYAKTSTPTLAFTASSDENSGTKSYIISVGTTSNGTETIANKEILVSDLADKNAPAISFTSILPSGQTLPDNTYFVRVQAKDNMNNLSAISSELKFMIDTVAPVISGEVNATDVSNRAISQYKALLTWSEATESGSGMIGYVVKRDNTSLALNAAGASDNVQYDAVNKMYSYLDDLGPSKSASYSISALDTAKNESAALAAKFNGTDSPVVILPPEIIGEGKLEITEPKATPSDSMGEKTVATITWKTSVPATSQVLYGETTDYALKTDFDSGLNSFHTVVLKDLKFNTTYHFVVVSKDRNGNEARSDQYTDFKDLTFVTKDVLKDADVLDTVIQNLSGSLMKVRDIISSLVSQTSILNTNQIIANSFNIEVEDVPAAGATVAISVAAAAAAAAPIANAMTLFTFPEFVRSLIYSIFSLGTRRKRRQWGKIIEEGTEMPIAQAKVFLIKIDRSIDSSNPTRRMIETVYSDNEGNYAFIATKGEYAIEVMKDMYHIVDGGPSTYKPGSIITVKSDSEGLIIPTILMSMTNNEKTKKILSLKRLDLIEKIMIYVSLAFLLFGTVTIISGLLKDPKSLMNIILAVIYPFLWFVNLKFLRKSSPFGDVVDRQNSQGVPLTLIRIMDKSGLKLVKTTITNQTGEFQTLVQKGQYQIRVAKAGYSQKTPVELNAENKIEALHKRIEVTKES